MHLRLRQTTRGDVVIVFVFYLLLIAAVPCIVGGIKWLSDRLLDVLERRQR